MKLLLHIVITLLLTILTQVGGVIYLFSLIIVNTNTRKRRAKRIGFFAVLYLIVTFLIVPFIAPKFGRERVKNSELIQAHSFYIILLNRNYVKPQLNQTLFKIARDLREKHKGVKLIYLDANFLGYMFFGLALTSFYIGYLLKKNIRSRNNIFKLNKLIKEVIEYMETSSFDEKRKYEFYVDNLQEIENQKRKMPHNIG